MDILYVYTLTTVFRELTYDFSVSYNSLAIFSLLNNCGLMNDALRRTASTNCMCVNGCVLYTHQC